MSLGEKLKMSQHYPYPSIDQFRNCVKNVRERAEHLGVPIPTITFTGTVKLHGTNASVVFPGDGTYYCQSRTRVISVEDDNHGFAKWVEDNKEAFQALEHSLRIYHGVVLYGEWFGQGIQSGVAVSSLPKRFVVFGMKQISEDDWFNRYSNILYTKVFGFVTIWDFPTYEITIDFSAPELSQNRLVETTEAVEKECPVGKQLGVSGVGEGVVWSPQSNSFPVHGLQFKVKGEKHSETKVKTLVAVDVEKIENLRALVDSILTEHRLDKKLESLVESGLQVDIKNTGAFLKLVGSDVYKEESDTILASGFHSNEVMGEVNKKAKKYWMEKLSA